MLKVALTITYSVSMPASLGNNVVVALDGALSFN